MPLLPAPPPRLAAPPSRLAAPPPRPPTLAPPQVRRRTRAVLWRHRFLVAALLVGLAATLVVLRLSPRPAATSPVIVAARALPAGTALTAGDLRTVDLPAATVPDGAPHLPADVAGRTLAVAVTDGTVLGDPVLVDDTTSGPPGTVVAGVRLAEAALTAFLTPGMHVDLLAATAPEVREDTPAVPATVLAERALVLPRPETPSASGGLLGGSASAETADLLLVAVTPEEAAYLANVSGREGLSAVVVR